MIVGCKKDDTENNSGIIIHGTIPTSQIKSLETKSLKSLSLADATKVLVFSKYYSELYDIVNNTFSVTGKIGTGVALIFLDADNKYIGNLSSQGLNMLPLGRLSNGENTSIDLSTLTLVGNSVIPSHDPFGNEIQISDTEINNLKVIDGYYKNIAKNIDTDNDGIPDVLSDKQLVIYTRFVVNAGHWGYNDLLPLLTDSSHYYVNYMLEIAGGSNLTSSNENIYLSGPVEAPYSDIALFWYGINNGDDRISFEATFCRETNSQSNAPWGSAFLPFKEGIYNLTLTGSDNLTFNYSNIDVKYNLVIVIPTLHTNSEGKLTSITLNYTLPDGTLINPSSMLTDVMVQLSDVEGQYYCSSKLTSSTGFSVLKLDTPLDISSLNQIDLCYDDLLGNIYFLIWR
jgi:hypothetical protein